MIFEKSYNVKISETKKNCEMTNKAILGVLEDVACNHSDTVGYGVYDIPKTGLTWLLLEWKLKVIKRPKYGEKIIAKTWCTGSLKCYALRDFEACDEQGNIIAIAASKWVLISTEKEKIVRVEDDILEKYQPEIGKYVFENDNFSKIFEPGDYLFETKYTVKRADIDVNNHMHNLNYLDLANEALPEDIYIGKDLDDIRISYKKEIKLGETVKCKYAFKEGKHIIVIKSEDDTVLHAIIEMQ